MSPTEKHSNLMMAKTCFSLLVAFLVWLWAWFSPPLQAAPLSPPTSQQSVAKIELLSVADLPAGFIQVPVAEVEGCQPQGDHGELAAFVFQQTAMPHTSICLSAFLLTEKASNSSQASLMREMMDALLENPEALIEQAQNQTEAAAEVEVLHLSPVGDKAMGFAKQDGQQRSETLVFRRGDILASIAVHYDNAAAPAVSLNKIATELDQHISRSAGSAAINLK